MGQRRKSRDPRVAEAFREVYQDIPRSVEKSGKTGTAKRKMLAAVALSKARARGSKIPKKK